MVWAPPYCTQDQLTDFAHTDDADDTWVDFARETASRAVDRTTHRQFGKVDAPQTRTCRARWSRTNVGWLVETADLMTLAGLVITYDVVGDHSYTTAVDVTKVDWLPLEAAEEGRPWERFLLTDRAGVFDNRPAGFRVTATWGWTPTWPTTITEATLLQGSRLLMRRDSPYGIAGNPEQGSEKRLLAKVDPDVEVALTPYIRRTWAR